MNMSSSSPTERATAHLSSNMTMGDENNQDDSRASHERCLSLALSTLQALELGTPTCRSTSGQQQPPQQYQQSQQQMRYADDCLQRLDTVLGRNQTATNNALSILNCSCVANSNVSLLLTLVISKILGQYRSTLLRGRRTDRDTGHDDATRISNTSKPFPRHYSMANDTSGRWKDEQDLGDAKSNALSKSGARAPRDRPENASIPAPELIMMPLITTGPCKAEVELEDPMIAHLILDELAKVSTVIDCFSERYCCHRWSKESGQESMGQLHFALETFLRSQLKLAMLAAQACLEPK